MAEETTQFFHGERLMFRFLAVKYIQIIFKISRALQDVVFSTLQPNLLTKIVA